MTVDFNDYFWGEKNNGFDVLYHNMKYGLVASKELADFLRERSTVDENQSKHFAKLAKQLGGCCAQGTFAPLWQALKMSAEKMSTLHMQIVQKMADLFKEVSRYADELHKKHKSVKDDESGTLEAVQAIQSCTIQVQKVKDILSQRTQEVEKAHRDGGTPKDAEKAEIKLKKCQEDYKQAVEKYNTVKDEFERKMTITCRHFQTLEESHLNQMKEFLTVYGDLVQWTHTQMGVVHTDFKRQCLELTVDKLLEQFVYSKYTGLEKPGLSDFDKSTSTGGVITFDNSSAVTSTTPTLLTTPTSTINMTVLLDTTSNSNVAAETVKPTKREDTTSGSSSNTLTNTATLDNDNEQQQSTATATTTTTTTPVNNSSNNNANAKTSRRTTSLLNLFMSNSQGSRDISRVFRGGGNSNSGGSGGGVGGPCSAPSSPIYPGEIARSTQRGSKWFLRSRRDKAKQKKTKKKKDADTQSNKEEKSDIEEKEDNITTPSSSSSTKAAPTLLDATDLLPPPAVSPHHHSSTSHLPSTTPPPQPSSTTVPPLPSTSHLLLVGGTPPSTPQQLPANTVVTNPTTVPAATTATAEIDEDGYTIQPVAWHGAITGGGLGIPSGTTRLATSGVGDSFYTSSDTDSEEEERERKIRVEIKPLSSNGTGPISASVDELRATVENLYLLPVVGRRGSGLDGPDTVTNSVVAAAMMKRSQSVSQQLGVKSTPAAATTSSSAQQAHHMQHHTHAVPTNSDLLALTLLQSNVPSAPSTPTTTSHPYTPLQSPSQAVQGQRGGVVGGVGTLNSPTLSASSRYADLGDLFCEVGELTTGPVVAASSLSRTTPTITPRQTPTPTGGGTNTGYMSIPRPPSRRAIAAAAAAAAAATAASNTPSTMVTSSLISNNNHNSGPGGYVSPAPTATSDGGSGIARADSVASLEFRTACVPVGVSRGPSPLTIGMTDTIPLAVAFHEIVHSYFRGTDENRCQVKMSGEMMLSFPAGIVTILANNPNPAKLSIRIRNAQRLNNILPNKQLVTVDSNSQSATIISNDSLILEFNMTSLSALLKKQSEQNPSASYFNVDILKYQIKPKSGANSCPFQLVAYWKCDSSHTDLKVDYKYNSHAMSSPSPLLNVTVTVPIDGSVRTTQSKPTAHWSPETNRIVWQFTELSQHSDNHGVGSLLARCELAAGPSTPALIGTQFNCEGTTLSGIDFQLVGPGYRLSLVKRRFISGKYICDGDLKYAAAGGGTTATSSSSSSTASGANC